MPSSVSGLVEGGGHGGYPSPRAGGYPSPKSEDRGGGPYIQVNRMGSTPLAVTQEDFLVKRLFEC